MPLALLALTISAFAIGTTEFVIVGLIPTIGADLGVSLPSAGLLVSLYALSVAIGAPLLTALTGRVPRKALLAGLMALFTVGNLVAWQAPGYESLIVALFGLVAFLGAVAFVPRGLPQTPPAPLARQLRVLAQPRLLLVYAMTAVGYGGSLIAFTYMAPLLEQIAGFTPSQVSLVLVGYGVSVAVGNVWGGKLADAVGPVKALKRIFLLLAIVLLALTFTIHVKWLAVLTMLAWGAVAFGNVPGLQVYVVKQARHFAPDATDVASGFNIAAFNLGVAGGSSLGGLIVANVGLGHTPWIAAVVTLGAFALTALSGRLDRRHGLPERTAEPVELAH
ncbi:MFS transporter [Burkholderia cenocepacia]|uniref:MFS transporter n=1 Tax=Burkholderia cenocepacia TaxID=95486 RepID=UPI0006668F63|nr:MFS transporter [Burkholderia cenocepacia]